eukprot:6299905-Alexandrium_andersonii.AAC.1
MRGRPDQTKGVRGRHVQHAAAPIVATPEERAQTDTSELILQCYPVAFWHGRRRPRWRRGRPRSSG